VQLSEATRNALQKPKDDTGRQMQLRFFCKAVDVPNTSAPALMEYPPICELKVNGRVVSGVSVANLYWSALTKKSKSNIHII
jgi:hypothetical protein